MKGAIRYKVTVSVVTETKEMTGKEWRVVGEKFEAGRERAEQIYNYTPEIEKVVQKDVQIYEQVVESLDMAALITAVNDLV